MGSHEAHAVNVPRKEFCAASPGALSDHEEPESRVDDALERLYLRKVDAWLVGFYSVVYIFRVIDSANYSNAAIINLENGTGIKKQLDLSPSQWSWTLSIFSYSYMVFEPSNTILLKTFKPSVWMFVLILLWGVSACSSAAAQDFSGMMCVRFAIGAAEAGFFPAVLYHMAFWYRPSELPQRIAIFYSVGQLSSALSGLLAYAISFMDGLGGLPGWRWLFVIEGLPAIVLAFVALFRLPDYPETSKLLTEAEREYARTRLGKAAPTGERGHWDWNSLRLLVRDPAFYSFSIFWICHGIGGFGVGYALPTVIYELGFTTTAKSQLMNIPPYVSAFLYLNTVGYFLHKKKIRPWTTAVASTPFVFPWSLAYAPILADYSFTTAEAAIVISYIVLFTVSNPVIKYIFLIVAVACAGSAYPIIWPERIRALKGTVASGVGIGFTNAMAQFSGIVGPHVYNTVFGPTYHVSYGICLAFLVGSILAILTSWLFVWRMDNNRRIESEDDDGINDAL